MKKSISTLMLTCFLMSAWLFPENADIAAIKSSGNYYFGSGSSFSDVEARDKALAELTSQIAVTVSRSFEQKLSEVNLELSEQVESIINTHSRVTLKNVIFQQSFESDGQIRVFAYLKKTEVELIFAERRKLISDMVRTAGNYLDEGNLAHSLKLYYFAALLLNSLPDQNVVFNNENFTTLIPERINQILAGIEYRYIGDRVLSEQEREITVQIFYSGKPVSLLDFSFWDGNRQVQVQARDGMASFSLLGASTAFQEFKLMTRYAYYESRREYNVIKDLWDIVPHPSFQSNYNLNLEQAEVSVQRHKRVSDQPHHSIKLNTGQQAAGPVLPEPAGLALELRYDEPDAPIEKISSETKRFLDLLAGDLPSVQFDNPLNVKISSYIPFNNPRLLEDTINADINRTATGWELRRIRMLHRYPSINKETTEYLVLDFLGDGTLADLNVGVYDRLFQEFVQNTQFADDLTQRQTIVKFLERYRSSYQVRDTSLISQMFSDDAIIIKGVMTQRKKLPPDMLMSSYQQFDNQPEWDTLRMDKQKFLRNEAAIFRSQQDLLVEFSTFNIIRKNNAPQVYGVELRQNYAVTTYADEGYLFLLIDFNEKDPLIYVRAWQPNAWDPDELINAASFKIHK